MPLPLALMAGAAGAKMLGGWLGSRSARKAAQAAANTQAGQAEENAALAGELPYRLNPYLQQSAETWGQNVRDQYGQSGADLLATAGRGATGVRNAAARGAQGATETAYQANALLDPYMTYGQQAGQMMLDQPGYTPTEWKDPGQFQFSQDDPSYQWRLQQGQDALERSAAGRGGLQSGATLKALTNYAQGAASQEYQNAFNRFMADRQQDFGEWSGVNQMGLNASGQRLQSLGQLAGLGANAAGRAGENFIRANEYGNTLMTDAERFGAGLETGAQQTAGGWGNEGARYQSDLMHGTTQDVIRNIMAGENARMGYMQDRASALAGGQLGAGQAQANMWANLGNAAGQGLTMAALMNGGGNAGDVRMNGSPVGIPYGNWGDYTGEVFGTRPRRGYTR